MRALLAPGRRMIAACVCAASALVLSACGGDELAGPNGDPLPVTAAFYPLREAAERIGGPRVKVTDLTPVGGRPHDVALSPDAEAALRRSAVVLYLGQDFQPRVDDVIGGLPRTTRRVDLLQGQGLEPAAKGIPGVRDEVDGGRGEALAGGEDPHVWVAPSRFITMVEKVRDSLVAADPDGREDYEQRATAYLGELRKLDADFRAQLGSGCTTDVIVTSHAAFGYLAQEYGLRQAAIAGVSAEDAPDARSLAAIGAYARANDATTIFFPFPVASRLASRIKAETGAVTAALNPVEGLTSDQLDAKAGYVSIQRENLGRLVEGLGCPTA